MKQALLEVMSQFYADGLPQDVIPRQRVFPELRNNATVITGMRRTGKTYFTYQRMRELVAEGIPIERIVHVNFDDERLRGMTADDLHWVVDVHAEMFPEAAAQKCWYFLDELQDVAGWEKFARRIVDSHKIQLCLTGSSSRMLSSDIATEMRGRSVQVEMFPLSFREFLLYTDVFKEIPNLIDAPSVRGMLKNRFAEYFRIGGFPDVQGAGDTIRVSMLQEYANAVVYRDIIERHDISSVQSLQYVLQYILHNFARKVSTRAISGMLKQLGFPSDRGAVSEYLSYYKDAYFAHAVPLRTDSLSRRQINPEKLYLADTGLIGAMTRKNEAENGWLLENLVFCALRRRGDTIEYYLTEKGDEVDFIVTDRITHGQRLVQVSWELSSEKTFQRELSALQKAKEETGIDDCVIVTWDEERQFPDGIRAIPAWKWALSE